MKKICLLLLLILFSKYYGQNISVIELMNLQKEENIDKIEIFLNKKGWEITNVENSKMTFGYGLDYKSGNSTYFLDIDKKISGNSILILTDLKKFNEYLDFVTKKAKLYCRKNNPDGTFRAYKSNKTFIFQSTIDKNRNVYSLTILPNEEFENYKDLCN